MRVVSHIIDREVIITPYSVPISISPPSLIMVSLGYITVLYVYYSMTLLNIVLFTQGTSTIP